MRETVISLLPIGDLSQQQQLMVEEIADYCPAEGGSPVYWARNIRQVYEPGIVYNDTLCQAESGHRIAREMERTKSDIKLYPNPASTEISVDLTGMDFDRWVIYSMDGKPMAEGRINSNEVLNISTSGMKSGQYILKLNGKDPTHIVSFIILNPIR